MPRRSAGGGKNRKPYERLSDTVKRTGEYELALPLDRMILEVLPQEGEMFAGLYEIGANVPEIRKKLSLPDEVSSTFIGSRLRSLQLQGLTIKVKGLGPKTGTHSWQRTKAADEYLAKEGSGGRG